MLLHGSFGCLEFFSGRIVGLQLVTAALRVSGGILLVGPTAILALNVQILLMLLANALLPLLLLLLLL